MHTLAAIIKGNNEKNPEKKQKIFRAGFEPLTSLEKTKQKYSMLGTSIMNEIKMPCFSLLCKHFIVLQLGTQRPRNRF